MSVVADVDGVRLTVPAGWWIWKYDDSVFHRNQFQNFAGGSKALDAIAMSTNGELWLIELKNYTRHRRTKTMSVASEAAAKTKATLAGLAVARTKANDLGERALAHQAMACTTIRIALQLAQPIRPSRLFPKAVDPQDVRMQLRREVHAVDAHPLCVVGDFADPRLPWTAAML